MSIFIRKKIRKLSNFRDLGGIKTADGRRVRPGLLYRSGNISKLSKKGAAKLKNRYGIKIIADLRSDSEQEKHPDVLPRGIRYYDLSALTDKEHPAVTKENRRILLKQIMNSEGGARGFLKESYRKMVTTPKALDAYSRLLKLLIDDKVDGAILWHCTQGKDRTGVGAAAILMALGVSREDIMKDYLRSNRYFRFKNKAIFALVCILAHSIKSAKTLNNLLTARAEYLQTAFDALDETFGGTEAFLHEGLHLSDHELMQLRKKYLA